MSLVALSELVTTMALQAYLSRYRFRRHRRLREPATSGHATAVPPRSVMNLRLESADSRISSSATTSYPLPGSQRRGAGPGAKRRASGRGNRPRMSSTPRLPAADPFQSDGESFKCG